jgi:hypothetical protein
LLPFCIKMGLCSSSQLARILRSELGSVIFFYEEVDRHGGSQRCFDGFGESDEETSGCSVRKARNTCGTIIKIQ